jgi:hypothetical protein
MPAPGLDQVEQGAGLGLRLRERRELRLHRLDAGSELFRLLDGVEAVPLGIRDRLAAGAQVVVCRAVADVALNARDVHCRHRQEVPSASGV